jgi:hypothetical protein
MPRDNITDMIAFLAVAQEAQRHSGCGQARHLAVSAEPHGTGPGITIGCEPAGSDDAQCFSDRCR